nr:MAG: RHS protein-like protein [Diabrotica toursvirus 3a]
MSVPILSIRNEVINLKYDGTFEIAPSTTYKIFTANLIKEIVYPFNYRIRFKWSHRKLQCVYDDNRIFIKVEYQDNKAILMTHPEHVIYGNTFNIRFDNGGRILCVDKVLYGQWVFLYKYNKLTQITYPNGLIEKISYGHDLIKITKIPGYNQPDIITTYAGNQTITNLCTTTPEGEFYTSGATLLKSDNSYEYSYAGKSRKEIKINLYDERNNIVSTIDTNGRKHIIEYYEHTNLIKNKTYIPNSTEFSHRKYTIHYEYIQSYVSYEKHVCDDLVIYEKKIDYNSIGLMTKIQEKKDTLVNTTTFFYEKFHDVIVEYKTFTGFDGVLTRTKIIRSLIHGKPLFIQNDDFLPIKYTYDLFFRLTQMVYGEQIINITYVLSPFKEISVTYNKNKIYYDCLDRIISRKISGNTVFKQNYDLNGKIAAVEIIDDVSYRKLFYHYDEWGNHYKTSTQGISEICKFDPILLNTTMVTTYLNKEYNSKKIFYDVYGNPIIINDGSGVHKLFYDGNGKLRKQINGENNSTIYDYDAYGNVNKIIFPNNTTIRKISHVNNDSHRVECTVSADDKCYVWKQFKLDSLFRIIEETTYDKTAAFFYENSTLIRCDSKDNCVNFKYNNDKLTELSAGDDFRQFGWDSEGRLIHYENNFMTQEIIYSGNEIKLFTSGSKNVIYELTSLGNVTSCDIGGNKFFFVYDLFANLSFIKNNDILYTFNYDDINRLCNVKITAKNVVTYEEHLKYDNNNLIVTKIIIVNNVTQTIHYRYDACNSLISKITVSNTSEIITENYHYDKSKLLLNYVKLSGNTIVESHVYSYDTLNNIIKYIVEHTHEIKTVYNEYKHLDPTQLSSVTINGIKYKVSYDTRSRITYSQPYQSGGFYNNFDQLVYDNKSNKYFYDSANKVFKIINPEYEKTYYHINSIIAVEEETKNTTSTYTSYIKGMEYAVKNDGTVKKIYSKDLNNIHVNGRMYDTSLMKFLTPGSNTLNSF